MVIRLGFREVRLRLGSNWLTWVPFLFRPAKHFQDINFKIRNNFLTEAKLFTPNLIHLKFNNAITLLIIQLLCIKWGETTVILKMNFLKIIISWSIFVAVQSTVLKRSWLIGCYYLWISSLFLYILWEWIEFYIIYKIYQMFIFQNLFYSSPILIA